MAQVKDIKICILGKYASFIGQKISDGTAWRTPKGGTHICRGNAWDIYREDLNASVRVFPAEEGTIVRAVVKTLPSARFRPQGIYYLDHAVMKAAIRIDLVADFTDATSDPLVIETDNFLCNAAEQTFSVAVPQGKTCYRVTVGAVQITPEGIGTHAYQQKDVAITVEPLHFTAQPFVYPSGAGTATASPSNPIYGQIVTFTAQDTNADWTFVKWRESGKTARSYSVQAFGDIRDTAEFADTSKTVDFRIRIYIDANRHICVDAKTLQNRTDQFVMVSFDIGYSDTTGMTMTLRYEREVYLNGQTESHTFEETASDIGNVSTPEISTLPYPYVLGNVEVVIDTGGPFMAESLKAGYSPWDVTADDEDD